MNYSLLRCFSAVPLLVALLAAAPARAEEPPGPDLDLARASALLVQGAENGLDRRLASLVVGGATGAVLIPVGTTLALRSGDVPHTIGNALLASAGGALFSAALAIPSSRSEQLRAAFQTRRNAGLSASELLRQTETEWSAAAEAGASRRAFWGAFETVAGGVFIAAGTTLMLAPQIGSLPRTRQYNIGAICLGTGVPFLGFGVHSLFVRSPEESSWAAYRAGRSDAPRVTVNLGIGPVGGGPGLFANGVF